VSQTLLSDFDRADEAALEEATKPVRRLGWGGLSLFWRTFFMMALLLLCSILGWLQALQAFEFEPRAVQAARQIASQVNLSRAALISADAIARITLLKTMANEEGLHIVPREEADRYLPTDEEIADIARELRQHLGSQTIVSTQVNGRNGLWISIDMDGDPYWFLTDLQRFHVAGGKTWMLWLTLATGMSLAGAALIARLVNRPLKELSFAASAVREGDFDGSRLDESVPTSEIREVNIGFNRMAQRLAQIDQDRALMLAGISHDLRTPLARLRLEAEMSVPDPEAQAHMVADVLQLDAIIDKFLDYARPDKVALSPLALQPIVDSVVFNLREPSDTRISQSIEPGIEVLADAVELGRVLTNLVENARKYGKSVDSGIADIEISALARDKWVYIKVRDHGVGVSDAQIGNLTQPFYRGEAARTAANGSGLGLSIVEKTCAAWAAPLPWPTRPRAAWPPTSSCSGHSPFRPPRNRVALTGKPCQQRHGACLHGPALAHRAHFSAVLALTLTCPVVMCSTSAMRSAIAAL